ncbi:TPA: hypothetical protein UOJ25_000216 [Stenotrophomonas maltophilia]|nr:hypothetical protein [Stenotrophomonas maltophilia]
MSQKPPTQSLAPGGISAFGAMGAEFASALDLAAVCRLPPYQMYVAEREPNHTGADAERYAMERTAHAQGRGELQRWLDCYVAWHAEKGCWRSESPFGEAR